MSGFTRGLQPRHSDFPEDIEQGENPRAVFPEEERLRQASPNAVSGKLPFTRRQFILGSGVAAAGMVLYSGEIARHEIEIVQRTILIANLPDSFHRFRIAQISDIHLDEYTEPFFLERVVK